MRVLRALVFSLALVTAAFAADLQIKVTDPQSAAVAGAQVTLLSADSDTPLHILTSSAEGSISVGDLPQGSYRLQVLAVGFAPQSATFAVPHPEVIAVQLHLAAATETVVVTATRGPLPTEEAGASISTLENGELEAMQSTSASDAVRFLPGVIVSDTGQRGGLTSLFVRGGDSVYNKVVIDGVPVNEPGGTFDFGVVPLTGVDRIEFLRGAQSTLYGSDAMTSVVQIFSRTGSTATPELRFGSDGGNFNTAHGFVDLSGARGIWDYSFFADQFNTQGLGVNNDYSNSLQGANTGIRLGNATLFRLRVRHSNNRTGVPGEWNFNGQPLLAPDIDARARQNNLLASAELTFAGPSHWQHRLSAYEYNHRRLDEDTVTDRGCDPVNFNFTDCFFDDLAHINRAGFNYQADYSPRSWLQTTLGYEFEDENGNFNSQFVTLDVNNNPIIGGSFTHGLRLNHALFVQQRVTRGRLSVIGGLRYVHNDSFGDRVVPRVAATLLIMRGKELFSGTRLRFAYSHGIKEPTFDESFGVTGTFPSVPNPDLKPEENHALEAGFEQSLSGRRYAFSAVYFNNQFHNQIEFETIQLATNPPTFVGKFINLNRSMAHGAEVEFKGRLGQRVSFDAAYDYTSTQVLDAPMCTSPDFCEPTGYPLIRRPKHSATLSLSYLGTRWGANLGGSFVGRRPDSDFLGLNIDHASGYVRADLGGWFALNSHVTAYATVENALDRRYNEVVGYPALPINFRAGFRFRIGGE